MQRISTRPSPISRLQSLARPTDRLPAVSTLESRTNSLIPGRPSFSISLSEGRRALNGLTATRKGKLHAREQTCTTEPLYPRSTRSGVFCIGLDYGLGPN